MKNIEERLESIENSLNELLSKPQRRNYEVMDENQLAEELGITKRTLFRIRTNSDLPHFKVGKKVMYRRDAVEEYKHKQETNSWEFRGCRLYYANTETLQRDLLEIISRRPTSASALSESQQINRICMERFLDVMADKGLLVKSRSVTGETLYGKARKTDPLR